MEGHPGWNTFEAFPLNVNPAPADFLPWCPHPLKTLRELKQAVKEDGAQGLFVLQMLESLSLQLNTPEDYKDICRAVLISGMFLTWKTMYYDEAEQQAVVTNKQMCCLWQKCYKWRGNMPHPLYKPKDLPNILTR
jgi:hypothetical protein